MRHPLCLLPALLAVLAVAAWADYDLEIGETAAIKLRVANHNKKAPVETLYVRMITSADWLRVEMPIQLAVVEETKGRPITWRIDTVPAGPKNALELPLGIKVLAKTGGDKDNRETRVGDLATIRFKVWKAEDNPSSRGGAEAKATDAFLVPGSRAWTIEYMVRATFKEMAKVPTDIEWHLAEAPRGSKKNEVKITIHNKSDFEPLTNVMVVPHSPPGPLTAAKSAETSQDVRLRGVEGLRVIKRGGSDTFTVKFDVSDKAIIGDTATLHLFVRTSTVGARPNPWKPVVFVSVSKRRMLVRGNFEAFLYYNLKPRGKQEAKLDEDTWLPLPKGTNISVSQVYQMPGPDRTQKPVEQYIGYGNVIDDRGYLLCKLSPVHGQSQTRLRIVADTMARQIEYVFQDMDGTLVDQVKAGRARAAVTPFGKRLFRNISHAFLVRPEKGHSVIEKEQAKRTGEDLAGSVKPTTYYRPVANLRAHFVTDDKVLIPYYGYGKDTGAKKEAGIEIKWEGELSSGGYIAEFGPGSSQLHQFMTGRFESVAMEQMTQQQFAGITYHNHNELHHVLAALVRAQGFLNRLQAYYVKPKDDKKKGEKPAEPAAEAAPAGGAAANDDKKKEEDEGFDPWVQLRGVVAYWRKGFTIPGGETGYMMRDGVHRLVVQNAKEDPDERDIGIILRGYGAAVRRRLFASERKRTAAEDKQAPNYVYYDRTTLEQAWAQGFDIFFAACVLNDGRILNEFAMDERDRDRRSVNLDFIFREASQAEGERIYDDRYHRIRGADNAVAVAAGLWRAAQALSPESVVADILANEGGSITHFLRFVAKQRPALLLDMAALGLCPRVGRWPPPASIKAGVSPDAVQILWHPNDVVKDPRQLGATLIVGPASAKKPARLVLRAHGKGGQGPVRYPYGLLRDGKDGEAVLKNPLRNDEKCYWTVETTLGKDKVAFKWPLQEFVAELPSHDVSKGKTLYARNGSAQVPAGTAEQMNFGNHTIHSVLGGRDVLGEAVYQLVVNDEKTPASQPMAKPVVLTLYWNKDQDPGDATPGIYYLNAATDSWELVGTKRVGKRGVQAEATRPGSYALMVDRQPPALSDVVDFPDPFPAWLGDATWRLQAALSEPAAITVQMADAAGKVVRTLVKDDVRPVGPLEVTWDGKDDAGKLVADGAYTYRLLASDASKLDAKPLTGQVLVTSGALSSARGEVKLAVPNAGPARIAVVGTSLSTETDAEGKFWLIGLTPGKHTLRLAASGHFEEDVAAEVKQKGEQIDLPATALTNVALDQLKASSEVFTPDGDGEKDYVAIRFAMQRACPLEAHVLDGGGTAVATLQPRKAMDKGEGVLLWHGLDDEAQPLPSGWYIVRLIAHSRTEPIPQGDVKVLLDRGLVQNAHPFPYTLSPNDDGFEDTLEIGYNLEQDGVVTVRLLRHDGTPLKELATGKKQRKGWNVITWDGKGADGKVVRDGRYAFSIHPKYPTGHESIVVKGDFLCDSRPPELGEVSPANGAIVETGTPTVRAKVLSDRTDLDPSQLRIKIDELTVVPDKFDEGSGFFEFTPKTSLGEGTHIAIAYAQDWAGNYAPPQAVSFEVVLRPRGEEKFIDRKKPEVLTLTPAKGTTVYTPTPLVTG
ncbi:hypothetical protein HQ576_09515, partial [bacterium]|nr:hypothetical protein [bacterium]